jgi:hypothetical protein
MLTILLGLAACAGAGTTGQLKLEVLGDLGRGAKPDANVFDSSGHQVGKVPPGGEISLPPGLYRLVLPVMGGSIERDNLQIESGRVNTVSINNVAELAISALDVHGKERGFDVTVTDANPPHRPLARFLTGSTMLFAPASVDIAVDAPPQGYFWHAVALNPGERARLSMNQVIPAQLTVRTTFDKLPIDQSTRVVIYQTGTQKQVAADGPDSAHRFTLTPGVYDIYVENQSGKGAPYKLDRGVHLSSGAMVEHDIGLDTEATAHGN